MPAPPRRSRALARDVDRHAAVVPLRQRHLRRLHLAGVLQAAELQRQQLRQRDAARHVGELELHGLRRRDRAVEQDAFLRVVQRFGEARDRRADRAPGDAVARLRQAAERTLEAFHVRQAVRFRHAHVVEEQRATSPTRAGSSSCGFPAPRSPAMPFSTTKPWMPSSVCAQTIAMCGEVAVGDPHLGAVDDPVAAVLLARWSSCWPDRNRRAVRSGRSSRSPCPRPCRGSQRLRCSSLP